MPPRRPKVAAKKVVSFRDEHNNEDSNDKQRVNLALLNLRHRNEVFANNNKVPVKWLVTGEELIKKRKLYASSPSKRLTARPTDEELSEYIVQRFKVFKASEENNIIKVTNNLNDKELANHTSEIGISGDTTDEESNEVKRTARRANNQKATVNKAQPKPLKPSPKKTPPKLIPKRMPAPPPRVSLARMPLPPKVSPTKVPVLPKVIPTKKESFPIILMPPSNLEHLTCTLCSKRYRDAISLKKHLVHIHKYKVSK